jgi:hypothetical protein
MPFVQEGFSIEVWVDLPVEKALLQFALHRVLVEKGNGGAVLKCARENLEPFAAMLLSLGCSIVVRKPPELMEVFKRLSIRAARAASSETEVSLS